MLAVYEHHPKTGMLKPTVVLARGSARGCGVAFLAMLILRDLVDRLDPAVHTAVTIGVFDGVHLGHQHVLAELRREADARGVASAVATFDTHPALVLRPENAPKLLTTLEQKLELLEANGVDVVYLVHFDEARSRTEPATFVEQVFVDALRARAVVVGEDFHFGRGRQGTVDRLREMGETLGFDVRGLELIQHTPDAPEPVSSTAIRRSLAGRRRRRRGGDARAALRGAGCRAARRRAGPHDRLPDREHPGVEADGLALRRRLRRLVPAARTATSTPARSNIGRRPTFYEHAQQSLLEAHLLDFEGDLYGEEARVVLRRVPPQRAPLLGHRRPRRPAQEGRRARPPRARRLTAASCSAPDSSLVLGTSTVIA